MIKAKAHRESQQASAPGHADYVDREPNRSNVVPVGFLLFVMACMAYLRSCIPFSSGLPKESATDHKLQNGDTEQYAAGPPVETDLAAGADADEEPTGSTESEKHHTSNVVPFGPRFTLPADELDNLLNQDSPLDFRDLKRPPFTTVSSGPIGDPVHPVNDNHPSTNHTGEAGGGGGGGGGGEPPPTAEDMSELSWAELNAAP
jgi:hypothetical protein